MLAQHNNLTLTSSGILTQGLNEPFAYSDGEESEQYLSKVLSEATDLSSTSTELEAKIRDWPSEYHLSNKRANLLRGLNLSACNKVLELGCGCGAITRYLCEQGLEVDAIEGSKTRAELAALRCHGLSNVNIVCANFNELKLPENTYDAVLLIGVVEYAARFWPQEVSEEEAVIRLLQSVKECLSKDGVVIIAIENRTGFKYVLGAHEDHYSKRYVGVHGYPEKAGIKTYTQQEWTTLVQNSGFNSSKYLLPFPDYKLPTVILAEEYALNNRQAYSHLEGALSRDYVMILDLDAHESIFWEAANVNGAMPKFSNSYLILLGDNSSTLQKIADNDFVHFPDFKRKPQYWVITKKRSGSNIVEKNRIETMNSESTARVIQQLQDETFIEGNLLSVEWARSLLIDPRASRFKQYLSEFYEYLKGSTLHIDLVPTNIIVDAQDKYRDFDKEWQLDVSLKPEYLLFRALLLFAMRHKPTLREFARLHSIFTIKEFIQFCFNQLQVASKKDLSVYIAQEDEFQSLVNRCEVNGGVTEQLDIRINEPALVGPVYARLYWKQSAQSVQAYREEDSLPIEIFSEEEILKMVFELPSHVTNISHFRFDPCDVRSMRDIGFLKIPYVRVEATDQDERREILFIQGNEQVAAQGVLSGIVFSKASYGEIFAVVHNNPEIEFQLDAIQPGHNLYNYKIEVHCTHVRSPEYQLARDRFLVQEEILNKRLSQLENERKLLQQEISLMKASKVWKWGQRCKSILGRREV